MNPADRYIRVNILFHGLFVFLVPSPEDKNKIEILIPNVHKHLYKAGPWMKEKRLQEGERYELTGVSAPNEHAFDHLTPDRHLVIPGGTIAKSGAKPYCTLLLPFPQVVTPLRFFCLKPGSTKRFLSIEMPENTRLNPHELPTVYVLTYHAGGGSWPKFEPLSWPANVNLHIFAETDADMSSIADQERHAKNDSNAVNKLFSGLQVTFNRVADDGTYVEFFDTPRPQGVNQEEELPLAKRTGRVGTSDCEINMLIVRNLKSV